MSTPMNFPVFKQETVKMGDFFDWFTPGNPKSGEFWHDSVHEAGDNFTGSHKADPDGKYRTGGAWLEYKNKVEFWGDKCDTYRSGVGKAYRGNYVLSDSNDNTYQGMSPMSQEDFLQKVNTYGAQAYAALKPDHPDFSPAASLFELRDIPHLLQHRHQRLLNEMKRYPPEVRARYDNQIIMGVGGHRGFGEYWLALKFGWIPLFSDILSFVRAFTNGKKKFNQMLRDEGKPVRRRRNLHAEGNDSDHADTTYSVVHGSAANPYMLPIHVSQCYGGGNATTVNEESHSIKVWCAGKSRYWLPDGPRDDGWRNDMARRILGLQFTPSGVYNAMPWTWLFDYFTSLGSFMDAISDGIADRVVFEYAYLMFEEEYTLRSRGTQYVFTGPFSTSRVSAQRLFTQTRKSRIGASPFGFGLKQQDLTPNQLGIMGALGLSFI